MLTPGDDSLCRMYPCDSHMCPILTLVSILCFLTSFLSFQGRVVGSLLLRKVLSYLLHSAPLDHIVIVLYHLIASLADALSCAVPSYLLSYANLSAFSFPVMPTWLGTQLKDMFLFSVCFSTSSATGAVFRPCPGLQGIRLSL